MCVCIIMVTTKEPTLPLCSLIGGTGLGLLSNETFILIDLILSSHSISIPPITLH